MNTIICMKQSAITMNTTTQILTMNILTLEMNRLIMGTILTCMTIAK